MAATPSPHALPGLAVLVQTPIIIEKIIWSVTEEQMQWKPTMDRWSICHERDRTLSWLRYVPATMVSRTGQHAAVGPITVGQLMNEWAFHDLGHIRQITELYRSRAFFPAMGGFQNYYSINP